MCLKGLQNICVRNVDVLRANLGALLGIVKTFMLYNVRDVEFMRPQKLMASPLSIPEPSTNMSREKKGGKVSRFYLDKIGDSQLNLICLLLIPLDD